MHAGDLPIFFDSSGKRWKRTKILSLLVIVALLVSIATLAYAVLRPVAIPKSPKVDPALSSIQFPGDKREPTELAYSLYENLPVIGGGAFLRVVSIRTQNGRTFAADIYSGQATKQLDAGELGKIGVHKYAIERYGPSDGRRIVLTFDDGPDPIYTPQILDILSKESANSTFFPIGANIVKYPEIAKRATREGHDVANHSFSHADLDLISGIQAEQEINLTQRIIRSATGRNPSIFRIPYGGNDDESVRDDRRAILEAQRLGYAVASYDIDSQDWGFNQKTKVELPELDGKDHIVLLHDGGGNRTQTIKYLKALIQDAKESGYIFTSLSRMYQDYELNQVASPTVADKASYYASSAIVAWPKKIIHALFISSVTLIFLSVVIGIVLAELQMLIMKPARRRNGYYPLVTVIIPAYNEEMVIKRAVKSVLSSRYQNIEIIVIDDGSTDNTWQIINELVQKNIDRVRGIRQQNAGKAVAVNRGISESNGEVIVSIDADTVFTPQTIGKLSRYFYYPEIGAVAGVVKVGNAKNWITRWQALEYVTSINIERAAQAFMRAITVAPGACSAWRKDAVIKAGGFSSATLAEDCDLALAVQKSGYEVVQDMEAVAYTESPETIRGLAKQRFRWLFGNIQAFWKHRDMFFRRRYGWLGSYVMPKAVIGIVMQLLFTPLLLFVMFGNLFAGEIAMLVFYAVVANVIMILTAVVALLFAHERFRYLTATPAFRLIYSPLRTLLLYASVLAALGGLEQGWNKVTRTGSIIDIK